MKTWKNSNLNLLIVVTIIFFLIPVLLTAEPEKKMISPTSDKLIYNPASKYIEFIGNVKVVYEPYIINSDNLKIFFLEMGSVKDDDKNNSAGGSKIDKIVATGNVIIKFDNKVATSDKAEYFKKTEDLVLSGKDTTIVEDGNSFVCTRVTYNRITQNMFMEGDKNNQLKGIIYYDEDIDGGVLEK